MDKFVKRIAKKCPKKIDAAVVSAKRSANAEESIGDGIIRAQNVDAENANRNLAERTELQQLKFVSPLLSEDFRLMEISAELADRIMAGEKLFVRGEPEDSPVLCTDDKTFEMKEVVTSNAMLLLPDFHFNDEADANPNSITVREVTGIKSNYLNIQEMVYVPAARLKEMLHDSELKWDDKDSENKKLYTVADLLDVVQMSELEVRQNLERLPVIMLGGYVRQLSSEYRDRLVTELVDCLDDDEEPGVLLKSTDIECLKEALKKRLPDKNIPQEAVEWLTKTYCNIVEENDKLTYTINEKEICRAKISQLLRAAVRFEYSTFEKTLRQILPIGVDFKDEYLMGLAFIDDELAAGKTIRYLNVEDLPEEPVKRLELLFSLRQSWKTSEMEQYFSDLCPTKRRLYELFMNYCRQSTVDGEKILTGLKEGVA